MVHAEPRFSTAQIDQTDNVLLKYTGSNLSEEGRALLEAMRIEAKPPPSPPPSPPSPPAVPCSVDMDSEWLSGFV